MQQCMYDVLFYILLLSGVHFLKSFLHLGLQCVAGDFLQAAKLYMRLNNLKKAIECFLLTKPIPWAEIAKAKAQAGQIKEALTACIKVQQLAPMFYDLHLLISACT